MNFELILNGCEVNNTWRNVYKQLRVLDKKCLSVEQPERGAGRPVQTE